MEEIERPYQRRIRLQKFPRETLQSIPSHEEIEAISQEEFRPAVQRNKINNQEGHHRGGLVKLDGVAANPVAEIHAPGQARGYAVGVIRQARKEAAKAP